MWTNIVDVIVDPVFVAVEYNGVAGPKLGKHSSCFAWQSGFGRIDFWRGWWPAVEKYRGVVSLNGGTGGVCM